MIRSTITACVFGLALMGCAATSTTTPVPEASGPSFAATMISGDAITDEALRGRVAIVDFWAVW